VELERSSPGELLDGIEVPGQKPAIPGWDILRRLGGEIAEVSAFAAAEELQPGQPLLLAGRFQQGCLFQMTLLPQQPQASWRLTVHGSSGQAELYWPQGWLGPAYLSWNDADGQPHEEAFPIWDPWPVLVARMEEGLRQPGKEGPAPTPSFPRWQDSIRALELDDAARRSLQRRRSSPLEYPEASEEVGFKGTMTLAGCGMVWLMLLLLIVSRWVPDAQRPLMGWLIVLLLVFFLGGQLLRYLLPSSDEKKTNHTVKEGTEEDTKPRQQTE
jgi:hypothetical protein